MEPLAWIGVFCRIFLSSIFFNPLKCVKCFKTARAGMELGTHEEQNMSVNPLSPGWLTTLSVLANFWCHQSRAPRQQPCGALCALRSSLSDLLVLSVNSGDIFIAGRSTAPISYRTHHGLTSD